jgi:hypothetical protein
MNVTLLSNINLNAKYSQERCDSGVLHANKTATGKAPGQGVTVGQCCIGADSVNCVVG